MTEIEDKLSPHRSLTPLWVISLFVTLTEVFLSIGVIKSTGWIQVALTAFVIIFPLIIAIGFFSILWCRPYVFYSPKEYDQPDVRQYVEAMQLKFRESRDLFPQIENTVRSELSSTKVVNELVDIVSDLNAKHTEAQIEKILMSVADKTLESIKTESFITIDSSTLIGPKGAIFQIPYNRYSTVSELLDMIWSLLSEYVEPFTYGVRWALREKKTGKILKDMGRTWVDKYEKSADSRSLSEVGIIPGIFLEVIILTQKQRNSWD